MQIYSISKILALPFVLILAFLAYQQFVYRIDTGYLMLIPLIFLVVLYILHPQIDYAFHKRFPLKLDPQIIKWLEQYDSFYNKLDDAGKDKFRYRMSLYMEGRAFAAVGSKHRELPEDIKGIIASNAVRISFNDEDFLIGDFDRIFVYKHAFPTPKHAFLHTVETEGEDGVLIFSLEHLIPGIIDPKNFYNIAMHGYADAYTKVHTTKDWPNIYQKGFDEIEAISGLSEATIKSTIGFDYLDPLIVYINLFFTYPTSFEQTNPTLFQAFKNAFNSN